MWLFGLWCCNWLPWHRDVGPTFWISAQTSVSQCSCGRQWATNHDARGTLPYDDDMKAFYARLRGRE